MLLEFEAVEKPEHYITRDSVVEGCRTSIGGYNDIKEGDMIEAYKIVEIKRTL